MYFKMSTFYNIFTKRYCALPGIEYFLHNNAVNVLLLFLLNNANFPCISTSLPHPCYSSVLIQTYNCTFWSDHPHLMVWSREGQHSWFPIRLANQSVHQPRTVAQVSVKAVVRGKTELSDNSNRKSRLGAIFSNGDALLSKSKMVN